MTIHSDGIITSWLALLSADEEAHRSVEGHPLRLFYGVDAASNPMFFLITKERPETPLFSSLIQVDRRERRDKNEWSLVLTLQDSQYVDSFIALCIELARISSETSSSSRALQLFFKAVNQWRQIFARNVSRVLKVEVERGLLAELWLVTYFAKSVSDIETAIQSWNGPLGAVHDFLLPEGMLLEVKATHMESRAVLISSLEQLDPRSDSELKLVVVAIETCGPEESEPQSISGLVTNLFEIASNSELATKALEERLAKLKIADSFASLNNLYTVTSVSTYGVSEGFPRIRRDAAPLGVDRVKYRLLLSAIDKFKDDSLGIDRG